MMPRHNAGPALPLVVFNVKNASPGNCLAVMRLAVMRLGDLECLIESLNAQERLTDPITADLVADPETRQAASQYFLGV